LALFYLLFVCRAMNLVQSYRAPRNVIYICFLTWTRPMTIEHMPCCCCCLHLGTRWTAYFTSALDSELLKSFCENLSVFWLSLNAKKDFNKKNLYVTISAVKITIKKISCERIEIYRTVTMVLTLPLLFHRDLNFDMHSLYFKIT